MTLEFKKVSVELGLRRIFSDVCFAIDPGEFVALVGRNGAGKTTLLRTLIRLIRPVEGRIEMEGQDLQSLSQAEVGTMLSYVPQHVSVVFDSKVTQFFNDVENTLTRNVISDLNIQDFLQRRFLTLSGGERQRVLLASALSNSPKLLLLDELTQYADATTTNYLGEFLRSYCASKGTKILAVSHDLNWITKFTSRALLLENGSISKLTLQEVSTHSEIAQVEGN